ncbi:MAG: hypothetical protein PHE04_03705 [Bacteroidales bacterium]|nr:hypothetical protein [Bacteroidales bacterium]MDD3431693.1 hypothetical protein [Bacteroidales bacterium]MDD4361984.1 hypothetical protein [Bacteroidales bacterium]MDD4430787.1 hypothetical protein [Bacteroidales bacterium]
MLTSVFYRFLTACLFFVSTGLLASEGEKPDVLFKAAWLKNEAQSYLLEHRNYSLEQGDTTELETITLMADVNVQDSTGDRYVVVWSFYDFSMQSNHYPSVWLMQHIKDLKISCRTTPVGVLKEFPDLANFHKGLDEAVESAFASYQGLPSETSRARVYRLREDLESFLLMTINHVHQAYGLGYTPGEVVDVPDKMETRFSETAIDAVVRKKLDNYDPETGVAGLVMATMLDSAQLNRAMQEYTASRDLKQPIYRQENTAALVMHIPSGWLLYGFDKREVYQGKSLYGEFFEITHLQNTLFIE